VEKPGFRKRPGFFLLMRRAAALSYAQRVHRPLSERRPVADGGFASPGDAAAALGMDKAAPPADARFFLTAHPQ